MDAITRRQFHKQKYRKRLIFSIKNVISIVERKLFRLQRNVLPTKKAQLFANKNHYEQIDTQIWLEALMFANTEPVSIELIMTWCGSYDRPIAQLMVAHFT